MKRNVIAQAAAFAEDARHGYATARETRAAIVAKFTAILAARAELTTEAEALGTGDALAADIAALDALFLAICRALEAEGLTLSGGEISALKRQGVPERLAAELDGLKRTQLPAAERLGAEDAAAVFNGLARAGLIRGSLATFGRRLGKLPSRREKGENSGLSWAGTPMQFSYFVWRFSQYTQRAAQGYINREKPLCLAFGIDERKRKNTIGPYLRDLRQGAENRKYKYTDCEIIDKIFNTL